MWLGYTFLAWKFQSCYCPFCLKVSLVKFALCSWDNSRSLGCGIGAGLLFCCYLCPLLKLCSDSVNFESFLSWNGTVWTSVATIVRCQRPRLLLATAPRGDFGGGAPFSNSSGAVCTAVCVWRPYIERGRAPTLPQQLQYRDRVGVQQCLALCESLNEFRSSFFSACTRS